MALDVNDPSHRRYGSRKPLTRPGCAVSAVVTEGPRRSFSTASAVTVQRVRTSGGLVFRVFLLRECPTAVVLRFNYPLAITCIAADFNISAYDPVDVRHTIQSLAAHSIRGDRKLFYRHLTERSAVMCEPGLGRRVNGLTPPVGVDYPRCQRAVVRLRRRATRSDIRLLR